MWTIFSLYWTCYNIVSVLCIFLVFFFFFGQEACGILGPPPGTESAASTLEGEVLVTGLAGKSQLLVLKSLFQVHRASLIISVGKESACNAADPSSITGMGRSPGEGISYPLQYSWASLVSQLVKNLPAMWETWVWSLVWKDPLEKGKATHSSILVWGIHGLYVGHKELDMNEGLSLHSRSLINQPVYLSPEFGVYKSFNPFFQV